MARLSTRSQSAGLESVFSKMTILNPAGCFHVFSLVPRSTLTFVTFLHDWSSLQLGMLLVFFLYLAADEDGSR